MKLSEHFDSSEFACHHCGNLPLNGMSPALIDGLEQLREKLGVPIMVSSGYRCPIHNYNVGGVWNSQHVKGTAADIYIDNMDVWKVGKIAKTIFDGVGEYYDGLFVHVDMRDGGHSVGYYQWDDQNN